MSENIYDIANQLERAIRRLPDYEAIAALKEKIDAEPKAKDLLEEFIAFQGHVQQAIVTGQMPTEADQEKMKAFGEQIEASTILKPYFEAQQRLSVYLTDIEKIIFKPFHELNQ